LEAIVENYQVIPIEGFDKDGEPEIRLHSDGKIEVMFNFMPPSNGNPDLFEDPLFEDFENLLHQQLGVEVEREDREIFVIPSPKSSTTQDLKDYLENFWAEYEG
jgi:hypothetical protein